jgi:hypothetical protein
MELAMAEPRRDRDSGMNLRTWMGIEDRIRVQIAKAVVRLAGESPSQNTRRSSNDGRAHSDEVVEIMRSA